MQALAERLADFADERGEPVTLVLDGRPFDLPASGVDVRFAPGGPNAADDAIAELVAADGDPEAITVATSDKDLVDRVRSRGSDTVGAREFRRMLDY
jgi:predicted RNA-binding protein with PIN domain